MAPWQVKVCPMAAGKSWCFFYAIVFHIVRVRSHVSHLLTFTWFPPNLFKQDLSGLTFGHRWPVLFWTDPCFMLLLFQMTDSQTKQHVYYRLGLCCILCTVFLDFMDFQSPDGSLWQGSALLGQHMHTLPRDHASHGQSQATPGPLSVHLLLYCFVPKGVCFSVGPWTSQKPSSPQVIV